MPSTPALNPARRGELALIACFLGLIAVVPVTQTWREIARGERVQSADVFRYEPTAKNLRQFERTLKDKSWFQQTLRPFIQSALFRVLRDPGAKVVVGRDDWLFYRADVRHLVEPNRVEVDASNAKWVRPTDGGTERESVVRAIVRFRQQLKERNIELLVVPVPGKPSVYPDQLTRRAAGKEGELQSPTLELLAELNRQGVATVNLFARFQDYRKQRANAADAENLYLARDTHWTPLGAKLAANTVAQKLKQLGWSGPGTGKFETQRVLVERWGDILEMMQIPGIRQAFPSEAIECEQVRDPALGLLVPSASDRPGAYKYAARQSSILVLGDSFCRIYQMAEPQSLGEMAHPLGAANPVRGDAQGSRRLLPGSAGFISHLALALSVPVDAIVSDGGAATDVRRRLSTNPELLEGKRVVIWEFVERDIRLGWAGWEDVPLPPRL